MSGEVRVNDSLKVEWVWQGDKLVLRIVREDGGIVTLRPGEINDLFHGLTEAASRAAAESVGDE